MTYEAEARALDSEILAAIAAWHERGEELEERAFDTLALRIFAHQLRYNQPYARYCTRLGITLDALPSSWEAIPAVPAPAFKEAAITTFDPARAARVFHTSGTTAGESGRHYLESTALYDAALLAGFDRFVLPDRAALRYLNLVPNPQESPHSSLGYMMARVAGARGDGKTGWYLRDGQLLFDSFRSDLKRAIAENHPVCIAATAFALVHLLEAMEAANLRVALPEGSRVMETGGFKGRTREVPREELYRRAAEQLGIASATIVAEYGMTELTSQHYDSIPRGEAIPLRRKSSPPWLRARVVGPNRKTLPKGEIGSLIHVDLANRASCIAIQTEDLGFADNYGFALLGRSLGAEPRGCSLDAEDLRALRA
ncbi:MAG TPA: hypothetical protein VHS56_01035 [Candidatus Cybelea sp.]|nr:hypothetical protein [Candidatus Cybelea sp.]